MGTRDAKEYYIVSSTREELLRSIGSAAAGDSISIPVLADAGSTELRLLIERIGYDDISDIDSVAGSSETGDRATLSMRSGEQPTYVIWDS